MAKHKVEGYWVGKDSEGTKRIVTQHGRGSNVVLTMSSSDSFKPARRHAPNPGADLSTECAIVFDVYHARFTHRHPNEVA